MKANRNAIITKCTRSLWECSVFSRVCLFVHGSGPVTLLKICLNLLIWDLLAPPPPVWACSIWFTVQSVDYLSTERPSCVSKASYHKEKVHSRVLKAHAIVILQQFYYI